MATKKKTLAELEAEYKRAEERAKALREQVKKATAAEDLKKKAELTQAAIEWMESYPKFEGIDDAIQWLKEQTEKNKAKFKEQDL